MLLVATGTSGFVMSHVLRHWLQTSPSNRALAIDIDPPEAAALEFLEASADRVDWIVGDVRDQGVWTRLAGTRADAFVHGATVTSFSSDPALSWTGATISEAIEGFTVNTVGVMRALGWAQAHLDRGNFVLVSSASVYGDRGNDPKQESSRVSPSDTYGHSKAGAEQIAMWAKRVFKLPVVIARLSTVFGELERPTSSRQHTGLVQALVRKAVERRPLRIGNSTARIDLIHASDAAAALTTLGTAVGPSHDVYNVGSGRAVSVAELADRLAERFDGFIWSRPDSEDADVSADASYLRRTWSTLDNRRIECLGWGAANLGARIAEYSTWLSRHDY